jgi:hypothetical protein
MLTPQPLTFALEDSPDEAAQATLREGLSAHSAELGLPGDWIPHWILGRVPDGIVHAGILFLTTFDWLFVHLLWVAEPYRRQGIVSRLIKDAEAAARKELPWRLRRHVHIPSPEILRAARLSRVCPPRRFSAWALPRLARQNLLRGKSTIF